MRVSAAIAMYLLKSVGNDNYNRLNSFDDKKSAEQSVMTTRFLSAYCESVTTAIR